MKYVLSAGQMKACDLAVIENDLNKSLMLIDKASSACVKHLYLEDFDLTNCLVVCGGGNNGADGFAIAKKLYDDNKQVTVLIPSLDINFSNESLFLMSKLKTKIYTFEDFIKNNIMDEFSVIIDALFGIGLSRSVEGTFNQIIDNINKSKAKVLSVDIPSGVSSDTGAVMKAAVDANVTVTFACLKIGQLLYPGKELCGKLILEDIGVEYIESQKDEYCVTELYEDKCALPRRRPDGNKGTFGKVLIIAGSSKIFGAAYLAAMSAYKCGCGMVHILTEKSNLHSLQVMIPEAILHVYDESDVEDAVQQAKSLIEICDVICAGPGLGTNETSALLIKVLINVQKPIILDADGLNIIAKEKIIDKFKKGNCIITPHIMEMSRLSNISCSDIKNNVVSIAEKFSSDHNMVLVLKDAVTVVAAKEMNTYINRTGNCAMAKAGSGDVLAGIITALVAQKCSLYKAAALGVYIHGLIGDIKTCQVGQYGLMARNLIDGIEEWSLK